MTLEAEPKRFTVVRTFAILKEVGSYLFIWIALGFHFKPVTITYLKGCTCLVAHSWVCIIWFTSLLRCSIHIMEIYKLKITILTEHKGLIKTVNSFHSGFCLCWNLWDSGSMAKCHLKIHYDLQGRHSIVFSFYS